MRCHCTYCEEWYESREVVEEETYSLRLMVILEGGAGSFCDRAGSFCGKSIIRRPDTVSVFNSKFACNGMIS